MVRLWSSDNFWHVFLEQSANTVHSDQDPSSPKANSAMSSGSGSTWFNWNMHICSVNPPGQNAAVGGTNIPCHRTWGNTPWQSNSRHQVIRRLVYHLQFGDISDACPQKARLMDRHHSDNKSDCKPLGPALRDWNVANFQPLECAKQVPVEVAILLSCRFNLPKQPYQTL